MIIGNCAQCANRVELRGFKLVSPCAGCYAPEYRKFKPERRVAGPDPAHGGLGCATCGQGENPEFVISAPDYKACRSALRDLLHMMIGERNHLAVELTEAKETVTMQRDRIREFVNEENESTLLEQIAQLRIELAEKQKYILYLEGTRNNDL